MTNTLKEVTITFYSQHLNNFLEFVESHYPDVTLEQIDQTILREYVSGLKAKLISN